jgi:ORF6N domain
MSASEQPFAESGIAPLIRCIRNVRVILDTDLAKLYGVQTFRLNEAVKRNRERFPDDFLFQLTAEERDLISQIAMSKPGRGGRRTLPYAFTEQRVASRQCPEQPARCSMSLYIIRAFVKIREEQAANAAILKRLAAIDKTLLIHDSALRDIYQKLRPLLEPPSVAPKPEIGFHVKEDAIPYRVKAKPVRAT